MVAGWMLHFILISALLLGAGLLLEGAARRLAWPQRWIWVAALAGSALLPLLGAPQPAPSGEPVGASVEPMRGVAVIGPVAALASPTATWRDQLPTLDPLLLGLWAGASGVLALIGIASSLRLLRLRRGWEETGAGSSRVLVSDATGPAVVGVFPGAIVLPRWALAGDPSLRRLMLAHEEEHLRARDPLVLALSHALLVLVPWNLPLWWQLRRLRLAVEVDCDARVLSRGSDLRAYATLLMEVGRRRSGLDPALIAFAEPLSFLERRIRIMTSSRGSSGWALAFALAAGSLALVVGACRLDQPTSIKPVAAAADPEGPVDIYPTAGAKEGDTVPGPALVIPGRDTVRGPGFILTADSIVVVTPESQADTALRLFREAQRMSGLQDAPAFTPREVEPELRNRAEFGRAMERAYPALLKDGGIGGKVVLWVFIDPEGTVATVRLFESSGYPQLDEAAMEVVRIARFSPAQNGGVAVPVWIALPVTFQTTVSSSPQEARPAFTPFGPNPVQALPPPADTGLAARPAFTPREVEPELTNRAEFGRQLERAYPAMLKDAGIGGRVTLWVFVDASGRVANVRLFQSSGYPQLDAAAESVIRGTARFTGALNRGQPVPVWIALPVTFQTTP